MKLPLASSTFVYIYIYIYGYTRSTSEASSFLLGAFPLRIYMYVQKYRILSIAVVLNHGCISDKSKRPHWKNKTEHLECSWQLPGNLDYLSHSFFLFSSFFIFFETLEHPSTILASASFHHPLSLYPFIMGSTSLIIGSHVNYSD